MSNETLLLFTQGLLSFPHRILVRVTWFFNKSVRREVARYERAGYLVAGSLQPERQTGIRATISLRVRRAALIDLLFLLFGLVFVFGAVQASRIIADRPVSPSSVSGDCKTTTVSPTSAAAATANN